jgi:hypothetical protein
MKRMLLNLGDLVPEADKIEATELEAREPQNFKSFSSATNRCLRKRAEKRKLECHTKDLRA